MTSKTYIQQRADIAEDIFSHLDQLKCPRCHQPLSFLRIRLDIFPYIHADLKLQCHPCDLAFLFGIPADQTAGLLFYTFMNDVADAYQTGLLLHPPTCPFHHQLMRPTKFWQDTSTTPPTKTMQFKCATCFLVKHVRPNEAAAVIP